MCRMSHGFALNVYRMLAALLFIFSSQAAYGLSEDAMNTLALESQLEERLKSVLTEIMGTEKVIVLVNVDPRAESGRRQDAVLLPGVPIKKSADKEQEPAFKTAPGKISVKKLSVTVLLDAAISESVKETVRDVSASVLGMSSARGDELFIRQIDFKNRFAWSTLFSPPNLYLLALSAAVGFFLITAALFLLNPFKQLPAVMKNVDWNLVRGNGAAHTMRDKDKGSGDETRLVVTTAGDTRERVDGDKESSLPFSFIQERHIPNLAFLLKGSSPRDIATVANYLMPELATRLFSRFPDEKQVEIALCLGIEEIDPERTRNLEETIKSRLDYVVGGERRLVSLLDMADEDVRDNVLKKVEARDSAAANRLRSEMKDLETLLRELPQTAFPVLCRNVDAALFAQVIKTQPDDIRARITASLSPGAAERLQQEMDLGRPLTAVRLKNEKRGITQVIRRMLNEGLIERENS